jgi:hypothetical protein
MPRLKNLIFPLMFVFTLLETGGKGAVPVVMIPTG